MITQTDELHLRRALVLATRGTGCVSPNPRVGCVIARGPDVLAEGWHGNYGGPHAEVAALANLPVGVPTVELTMYVTLEPCNHHGKQPPCTDAIVHQHIPRVVIGMRDPNPIAGGGALMLERQGVAVEFASAQLQSACLWINRGWVTAVTQHRPYVIGKIAQSMDGYMAPTNRTRLELTGTQTRVYTHQLRSEVDAVLVGMGTVRADNPRLTVRDVSGRSPVRIIVGNRVDVPNESHIAQTLESAPTHFIEHGESIANGIQRIHLQHGIQTILCEAGPTIISALLTSDIVDELRIHTAPVILGEGVAWHGPEHQWQTIESLTVDGDVLTTYVRRAR